jgi:hypothetical protein
MIKYIILSLIVLYIYNTYVAPISEQVKRNRHQQQKNYNQPAQKTNQKVRKEDYIEYEEVKD